MSDDSQAMTEWIRQEQTSLWSDLGDAIRYAANGVWSIHASNVARRIIEAARLVGPVGHGEVPWSLTIGGIYEAVLTAGDIPADMPDEAEWARLKALMADHSPRDAEMASLAATVETIRSDRERRWIAGEDE